MLVSSFILICACYKAPNASRGDSDDLWRRGPYLYPEALRAPTHLMSHIWNTPVSSSFCGLIKIDGAASSESRYSGASMLSSIVVYVWESTSLVQHYEVSGGTCRHELPVSVD